MGTGYRGNVLVVEDEDVVRDLIVHVLQRNGYWVSHCENGLAALEILRHTPVDMVLTDLRMPVMGGLELLRSIRQHHLEVDTVVLTAYGTVDSAVEALKLGALDYIPKPFAIGELLERIELGFKRRTERLAELHASSMPLLELNRILSHATDLSTPTLDAILELVATTFRPDRVRLMLYSGWGNLPWPVVERGSGAVADPLPDVTVDDLTGLNHSRTPWRLTDSGVPDQPPEPARGRGITVPIANSSAVIGALQVARGPDSTRFSERDAHLLYLFGAQIGLAVLHGDVQARLHRTFGILKEFSLSAAETLVDALGAFDEDTREHSRRVARYGRQLAESLGLADHRCDMIEIAGLLHDIGKLGVGETTIRKNGHLTDGERERVRLHPVQGARILERLDNLAEITPLVRHHHERYDGEGYPQGLKGEQIPLGTRLLAVVDAYDSMTTDRPYQGACTKDEALQRLYSGAGNQFDPHLVEVWTDLCTRQQAPLYVGAALANAQKATGS